MDVRIPQGEPMTSLTTGCYANVGTLYETKRERTEIKITKCVCVSE